MPKIDLKSVPVRTGTSYPAPFHLKCQDRVRQRLGQDLRDFGVNLLKIPPGVWSSQRHWHSHEDEFIFVVSGELVLVTDKGDEVMHAGDCAVFPKNLADGHQLINRSNKDAFVLEVGSNFDEDVCTYTDIDMKVSNSTGFTHKDGKPYPIRGT